LLASAFQLASIPSSIFAAHGALHAPLELHHLWDIAGDDFSMDDNGILDITSLSLDEPELEVVFF